MSGEPVTANNAPAKTTAETTTTTAAATVTATTTEATMATKSSTKSTKDLTNLITMVVTLFLLGTIGHLYGETAHFSLGHITGFHAFLRFLNIDAHGAAMCGCWPHNMVVTLAILNGVRSNRTAGHWAGDIVKAIFATFGGLIVNDILNAKAVGDFAFWNFLPVTVLCWYFVNHDLPMTKINVWTTVTENMIMDYVPLGRIMNLCTLAFNCSLLFAVAAQHPMGTFWHVPMAAKGMAFCIAVHCSSDFFGPDGFKFSFDKCSVSANRAVLVYFWIASHGLSTVFASLMGKESNGLERLTVDGAGHLFGASTTQFCWAMIVLAELFQDFDFVQESTHVYLPHTFVQKHLNQFFFASQSASGSTSGNGGNGGSSGNGNAVAALEARVAELEAANANSSASVWGLVTHAPVKIILLGAVGFFFGDADRIGFDHMSSLDTFFHGSLRFLSTDANTTVLHAVYWPQTILVTLAIWNGVKNRGNGGYWVNNIILSVFSIFGGLIMNDILNATPVNDYAFWNFLPVTIVMWYLVNYNLPYTSFNVFGRVESMLSDFLPLEQIMNLCTLSFNCSLLFTVAAQHEAGTFWYMPQLAKGMFFCVAVHCATDFIGHDGFHIHFDTCSSAANRAVLVYVWTATHGLSTLGVPAGQTNGFEGVTALFGSVFGEGASFLWAMILLGELFGDQIPWKPHQLLQSKLNNFFKP